MNFFHTGGSRKNHSSESIRNRSWKSVASELRLVRGRSLERTLADDRLARGLLTEGVVSRPAVYTAWAYKHDHYDDRPLWRILSDVQGTDSTRLLRFVAQYYSFIEADVSIVGTEVLIRQNRSAFEDSEWRRMIEFGIFPIREKNNTLDGSVRWTIATFDPTRRSVRHFIKSRVRGSAIVRFAPPVIVFDLVSRCTGFPKPDALPWYRKYVLGRLPIALRPFPAEGDRKRAA